jgi:hypothetical protein
MIQNIQKNGSEMMLLKLYYTLTDRNQRGNVINMDQNENKVLQIFMHQINTADDSFK